jgi:AcrR family transcriptional regulator
MPIGAPAEFLDNVWSYEPKLSQPQKQSSTKSKTAGRHTTKALPARGRASASASESPRTKRKQIVEAAIKVFLKEGYAATTLQKVAAEAKVIRATIYSHFGDKNELFVAIVEELTVNRFGEGFEQRMLSADPKDFVFLLRDFVQQQRQNKQFLALLRIVIGESDRFPQLARLYFKTIFHRGISIGRKYFEQHRELGVKDPYAMAAVVGGSMMACLIQQELLHGKEIAPLEVSAIADTLVELISRPPVKRR